MGPRESRPGGKLDGFFHRLGCFAGQAKDEEALARDAHLGRHVDRPANRVDGFPLLDIAENLRIGRLDAVGEVVAAGPLHQSDQLLVDPVGPNAVGARPTDLDSPLEDQSADGFHVAAFGREVVVLEVDFPDPKPLDQQLHLVDHVFRRAESQLALVELRTGAEGARLGTTAGGRDHADGKALYNRAVRGLRIGSRIDLLPIGKRQCVQVRAPRRPFVGQLAHARVVQRVNARDGFMREVTLQELQQGRFAFPPNHVIRAGVFECLIRQERRVYAADDHAHAAVFQPSAKTDDLVVERRQAGDSHQVGPLGRDPLDQRILGQIVAQPVDDPGIDAVLFDVRRQVAQSQRRRDNVAVVIGSHQDDLDRDSPFASWGNQLALPFVGFSRTGNRCRRWRLPILVVLPFRVHGPDIGLVDSVLQDVVDGRHGREHRVVHVVVTVHAVAADQKQVLELIEPGLQLLEPIVGAEIGRVGLGHPDHRAVEHVGRVDDAERGQLPDGQGLELLVPLDPQVVVLVAEVLHAHPDLLRIGHQVRAPVIEDLQPAHAHVRLLNVDPIVADQPAPGMLVNLEPLEQQSDGEEVAIEQPLGNLPHRSGGIGRKRSDQLLHRHGREAVIGREDAGLPGPHVDRLDTGHAAAGHVDPSDLLAREDVAAHLPDLVGHVLPHLARAELGVEELLDQRRLGSFLGHVSTGERPLQGMQHGLGDGEPFDPLGAPFGTDLRAGNAPDFLRVGLEEGLVQLASEPVDEELFQRLGIPDRAYHRPGIARPNLHHPPEAQLAQRVHVQADGIIEELATVEDPRSAQAQQHDRVDQIGVRSAGRLDRHPLAPPSHDSVRLREEPVAADVDAVSLVVDRPRQAPHGVTHLQHDRPNVRPSKQFVRRGQAGRAGADNQGGWLAHVLTPLSY